MFAGWNGIGRCNPTLMLLTDDGVVEAEEGGFVDDGCNCVLHVLGDVVVEVQLVSSYLLP